MFDNMANLSSSSHQHVGSAALSELLINKTNIKAQTDNSRLCFCPKNS